MSSNFRVGWAARRENTCNHDEYGKQTWDKWMGCCPSEMTYSTDDNDNKRCTFGDTPSGTADTPTQCADPSLFLWSDSAGYFCCDKDMIGFVNNVHWKGCVSIDVFSKGQKDGSMTKATWNGQKPMSTTSASPSTTEISVITTTSTSSSHSASATSTTSTSSPNSDSQGSSINTGPIIGGVVGGIGGALLILGGIWFLFMRRRSSVAPKTLELNDQASSVRCRGTLTELNSNVSRQEVLGSTPLQQHELPGNKPVVSTFSELS